MNYAKSTALHDIKRYLKEEGKPFIPYIKYLDPVMRVLTRQYIKKQNNLKID